jgi:glucosyl-3-phosphoglycerate synthase
MMTVGPRRRQNPSVRTFHHRDFNVDDLVAAKAGRRISVVIPARDEEATVGPIVARIRRDLVVRRPLVDEVLVVDDGSSDRTAATAADAGARVVRAADVLPEAGPGFGKGEALWKGTAAAEGDIVAFCDADVRDFNPRFVVGLVGPLLQHGDVRFVKAFYVRPIDQQPRGGGRVTELMARPLITVLFPQLAPIIQPLAGEFAAPKDVLVALPFVQGYGVDLGLLIDAAAAHGVDTLAQVDLGTRVHRNRPLDELAPMATVILQTALFRAGVAVPSSVQLSSPEAGAVEVRWAERPALQAVDRRPG